MKWLALHVGGQKWGVYVVSAKSKLLVVDGECHVGRCYFDRCRIYLSKELGESAREDALLHELLHALLFVSGAESSYGKSPEKEESLVQALTPCLHRLLKDLGFRFPKGTSE